MRAFPMATLAAFFCLVAPWAAQGQRLVARPGHHDFGNVQIGKSESFTLHLKNISSRSVTITAVTLNGAQFSLGKLRLPAKLRPHASLDVSVSFAPAKKGTATGSITVTSDDPKSPTVNVQGTGVSSGGGTTLTISPSSLDFGNVKVGTTASLQTTLTATGGSVTISSDSTNSSEFSITGLALPVTLASGKSVQATIQFTPNASGNATGKAGFVSDAGNSPTLVNLTGTGVAQSQHEADLSWDAGEQGAIGYNVYRGNQHGGPYSQVNYGLIASTSFTDYDVVGGTTYYYVTTEVNSQGQESGYSNEAKAKIPN